MILQTNQRNIDSSLTASRQFGFNASAKAFAILSDLYSDRIHAILRELGTNAADAHVAAGTPDRPFYVHVPTDLEPFFAIRDYGPGMSYDEIMVLYSTYFESTKTTSNLFTGALGLGSKSPFSYTDNFSIQSVQNGLRSEYLAFLSEDQIPLISCVSRDLEVDEEDGLRVQFAVPSGDVRAFADRVEAVYGVFDVRPQFNIDLDFPMLRDALLANGGFTINLSGGVVAYISPRSRFSLDVLEGNILYPSGLDPNNSSLRDFSDSLKSWLLSMYQGDKRIVLHTPVGTVEPAPSRDALKLTQQTKQALIAVLEELRVAYLEQAELAALTADSVFDGFQIFTGHVVGSTKEERLRFLEKMYEHYDVLANIPLRAWSTGSGRGDGFYLALAHDDITYLQAKRTSYQLRISDSSPVRLSLSGVDGLRETEQVVWVDPDQYDLDRAKKRIKQHMRHADGALDFVRTCVVTHPVLLDLVGVEPTHIYDETLDTVKHLKNNRASASFGRRSEVKNYDVVYNGLDLTAAPVGQFVGHSVVRDFVSAYGAGAVYVLPQESDGTDPEIRGVRSALAFARSHRLSLPFVVFDVVDAERGLTRYTKLRNALPAENWETLVGLVDMLKAHAGVFRSVSDVQLLDNLYRHSNSPTLYSPQFRALSVFAQLYGVDKIGDAGLRDAIESADFPPPPNTIASLLDDINASPLLAEIFAPTGGVVGLSKYEFESRFDERYALFGHIRWQGDFFVHANRLNRLPEDRIEMSHVDWHLLLYMKAVEKEAAGSERS